MADDRFLLPTDFDDEDGLIEPSQDLRLTTGTAPQVRVRATNLTANPATLYAWIDYDSDGLFENGSETCIDGGSRRYEQRPFQP